MDNNGIDIKASEGVSGFRRFSGPAAILVKFIGAGGCLFALLEVSGVFFYFNTFFLPNQYNAIILAIVLTLTFLLVPATKKTPRNKVPWYDFLLILAGLAACVYTIINAWEILYFGRATVTPFEAVLAALLVITIMEAVRRSFGWPMVIIALLFILYVKFGYLVPGPLSVHYFTWSMIARDLYLSSEGIFGTLTSIATRVILVFIAFGVFFVAVGGGKFFLNLALGVTGTMRGGPAKAAVVGSALFGTISGSPTANVAVTGSVTIPLMKSIGYKSYYAGAIESIASTGGMIAPPIMGGVAFIMAQLLNEPYSYVATISFLPAFLYFLSLFLQVHLHAVKVGLRGLPRKDLPSPVAALKEGWELAIPFIFLVVLLFVMKYPAEMAAVYTVGALVAISLLRKSHRMNLRRFIDSLDGGMQQTLSVTTIIALAAVILAALVITGVGLKISSALVTISAGSMLLLILLAGLATYILGMGISLMAAFVLVAAIVGPALQNLGLPIIVSYFFIMYMVTATVFTPPYCTAAYVAGAIANAHPFRVGFQAMRLGVVTFLVPFIIVYNPALILQGSPGDIALAATTAIIGIFGLSVGLEGYLFTATNWLQRILFIVGGIVMVVPGLTTDIIGAVILVSLVIWQRQSSKLSSPVLA
ncbi:MAG: TRAP transporter fused permease subunit [Chloroflexi bacterium]|nr:TRAP transporter fused permease subunit [Chloroflexota bacterium]